MLQLTEQKYSADMRCTVAIHLPGEVAVQLKPARLNIVSNGAKVDLSLAIGDGTEEDSAGLGEIEIPLPPEALTLIQKALKQAEAAIKK